MSHRSAADGRPTARACSAQQEHGSQFSRAEHSDPLQELGAFIRQQRSSARLSLRHLSELAGISNPYLSQIERGLRRPSAEILQQIARGLRISAETLYVRAGILDERVNDQEHDLGSAIAADRSLSSDQRHALLVVYRSFLAEQLAGALVPTNGPAEEDAPPAWDPGAPPEQPSRRH